MVLLILGDSQVQRIWPSVRLDREVLRDAIYFPVKSRDAIVSGYQSITASVNMVILSFLTNIIVDTLSEDSNEASLNQLFIELFTQTNGLFSFCSTFPTVRVFLAPPNVRLRPNWYSRLRPTIIRVLHQFLQTRPPNLQLLEDYSGDLEKDGIHYNILAGINFVKGLADQVIELMKSAPPDPNVKLVTKTFKFCFLLAILNRL